MLNLKSQKASLSSRGRKFLKQPVCSFNKFQDFILAKSKQKTPKAFFVDRASMTGQIKIEKLNFSKTTSQSQFLPPKSIDNFCKSTTNRNGFSVPKQQLQMSQTQTPFPKTKIWSFESTNEEYLPRPQQIKAKIQSNAMQRFQQLFKKQTSIRAKRIEEEQSKRLMRLLENTSRKQPDSKKNSKASREFHNGYINYGNLSKKKLSQDEKYLSESTFQQKPLEDQNDTHLKAKQTIKNHKIDSSSKKNSSIGKQASSNQTDKNSEITQSKKNSFFQDKNSVDLAKQIKKMTIELDDLAKNTSFQKYQLSSTRKSIKKTENYTVENVERGDKKTQIDKIQLNFRKYQQKGQMRQTQVEVGDKQEIDHNVKNKVKQKEDTKISLKKFENINTQKKTSLQATKSNHEQQNSIQTGIPKQKQLGQKQQKDQNKPANLQSIINKKSQQQYTNKNSFKINQFDVLDHLPTIGIIQKHEPSIKQMQNPKLTSKNLVGQMTKQEEKGKISLEEIIQNKGTGRQNTEESIASQQNHKTKNPITIKGAKEVKPKKNQVNPNNFNDKHHHNIGQDDIDDLQQVSVGNPITKKRQNQNQNIQQNKQNAQGHKSSAQKSQSINIQKDSVTPNTQKSSNNIKPSTSTSLANGLDNKKTDNRLDQNLQFVNSNSQNPSQSKLPPMTPSNKQMTQIKTPSEEKVQFNESQSGSACPADELGYLLDMLQTLGSYYTDSKHFYSQPDSSMVEVVMDHKLTSYFLAQQYYFYINLFLNCASASNKQQFYSLSAEEFQQALQDEEMTEGIQQLERSSQLAVKLIKMTFERCKMYLKKHQKDLTISPQLNYHKRCVQYLRAEFQGLYNLYLDKTTSPLGKRLCYIIETYSLLMYLNQEEIKEYEDVQDLDPQLYTKHINKYKHLLGK